jgi:aminoglycoside phosphotransferase (APT) family kinase protein
VYISEKLPEYVSAQFIGGKLAFLPFGVTSVRVSDINRLGGGSNEVYSLMITYRISGSEHQLHLILKTCVKSLEPILKPFTNHKIFSRLRYTYPQLYQGTLERCVKEFQVLHGLERVDFPAPRAYLCECDSNVLGFPFIIMQKEEIPQNRGDYSDCSAKYLARLHNLEMTSLGIDVLKAPTDDDVFARRCLSFFKVLLNFYPKHCNGLKKDFEFAIRWLESNISNARCPKYCLIHGDYHPNVNTVLRKDPGMIVIDWEDAEIGDPAYDVGYAYTRVKADWGEKTADQFVQEYIRYFGSDIDERLLFYKLVAHLGEAILHSSVLSNPLTAYEIRGTTALLSFPFLRFPFIAKNTGTALDVIWPESFKEFVEENLK